ncbi:hypothetical protein J3458_019934 [Metarhizium acridum]|uniref:uncharacterized protein n=1 Tax=Metarhizium acridum TaxID=92637 RepID=UPI001C6B75DC|nr:hypothetical protein J3458_019934 [Metarhizium acridum]
MRDQRLINSFPFLPAGAEGGTQQGTRVAIAPTFKTFVNEFLRVRNLGHNIPGAAKFGRTSSSIVHSSTSRRNRSGQRTMLHSSQLASEPIHYEATVHMFWQKYGATDGSCQRQLRRALPKVKKAFNVAPKLFPSTTDDGYGG